MSRQTKVQQIKPGASMTCCVVAVQLCPTCRSYQLAYIGRYADFQDPQKQAEINEIRSEVSSSSAMCITCNDSLAEEVQAMEAKIEQGGKAETLPMATGVSAVICTMPMFIPDIIVEQLEPGKIFVDPASGDHLTKVINAARTRASLYLRRQLEAIAKG